MWIKIIQMILTVKCEAVLGQVTDRRLKKMRGQ